MKSRKSRVGLGQTKGWFHVQEGEKKKEEGNWQTLEGEGWSVV